MNFHQWLDRLEDKEQAQVISKFHTKLISVNSKLPSPICAPRSLNVEDNQDTIYMSFDNTNLHLDFDINIDGSFEWFFRNRNTDHYDGSFDFDNSISQKLIDYIRLFI